jgi:hypothetical protein
VTARRSSVGRSFSEIFCTGPGKSIYSSAPAVQRPITVWPQRTQKGKERKHYLVPGEEKKKGKREERKGREGKEREKKGLSLIGNNLRDEPPARMHVAPRTRDTTRTRDVIHARMSAVNTCPYLRDV